MAATLQDNALANKRNKPNLPRNARARAASAVEAVLRGRSLDDGLASACKGAEPRDVGLIRALAYGAVRELGSLRWLIRQLTQRPPQDVITALLAVGLVQLRSLRVPEHAAVSETVDAAAQIGQRKAGGMINAVLRRYLREHQKLNEKLPPHLDMPDWLLQHIRRDWDERWPQVLASSDEPAPMTLRVNSRAGSRDSYLESLATADLPATAGVPTHSVILEDAAAVEALPGFAQGRASVQDCSAQLAAELLAPKNGERVLDACAAPGGKAAHLLELADIDLVALDIAEARQPRVHETLERLSVKATVLTGDAAQPDDWWDGKAFDAILVDAPCSGTGVIRRHPDIKWLRRASDIAQMAARQTAILTALWPLLKPGGRLLYATCSILDAENRDVLDAWLATEPSAQAAPIAASWGEPAGVVRRIAPGGAWDGFYFAMLLKHSVAPPTEQS